jgi:hypothetical protein
MSSVTNSSLANAGSDACPKGRERRHNNGSGNAQISVPYR